MSLCRVNRTFCVVNPVGCYEIRWRCKVGATRSVETPPANKLRLTAICKIVNSNGNLQNSLKINWRCKFRWCFKIRWAWWNRWHADADDADAHDYQLQRQLQT